ncbi:MAG: tyrosine recombinase XerC [Betaproteobacteria bacterium RIFCSPLOWO2_12_FULL_62_58]|nr:MAG: tyrosine recombinase XerC [Betaproteobacteria bacterium RIFCSPLOWO2_12_FULL_62_58]
MQAATAQEFLRHYLAHLANERRLSAHTGSNYKRDIDALIGLAGSTPLDRLQVHQIRRFIAQLHARGLDGRSLARMLSAWRGFFKYLSRDHGFGQNPCLGIRAPRAAKKLPHALSPDEAGRLMDIRGEGPLAVRDKAILELFYSSGLRLSELTGLKPMDINFGDATVRVTGKGSKTRIVPVGSHALTALQAWLAERSRIAGLQDDALFVSLNGTRLGPRAVQLRLKQWAVKQGLGSRVHPHALRHSFASHVLQSSGDLRAVQDMLGHASISTTQVYTQLDFQHLAKVYDAAHPRAKRKS